MRVLLLLALLVSCSSRPTLYPNTHYKEVGKEAAQKDVDLCMKEAQDYLDGNKTKQVAKSAGLGAAIGTAWGLVIGLFTGDYGRALVRGAASGGAIGATAEALSPDQIKQRYVNQCLAERGYQVIGWD